MGREGVLGTRIHHQEKLREEVVEEGALKLQVVRELRFELRQAGGLVGVAGDGALIRARKPCGESGQLRGVRVAVGVAALEVAGPIAREVGVFPQNPVAGVVENFPGFIALRKTVHFRGPLVVVEVVLAKEGGLVAVPPEDHHGEAVDALPDGAVGLLGRRLVGAGVVVKAYQLHVVGALRAGHVGLEGEGVHGDSAGPQGVLGRRHAVHHKAALEGDFVVLPGVVLRRSALHVDAGPAKREVPGAVRGVHEAAGDGLLVALVLGQLRSLQDEVREVLGKVINHDLAVVIVDLVTLIPGQEIFNGLGIGDPVVEDLVAGEAVVVDPDAVDVRGAGVGADGDAHRAALGEVIVRGVLDRAGEDAVDVDQDQAVLRPLLHHEGQADVLVLLVLGGDLALLRGQGCFLRRHLNAPASGEAGDHGGVVVHDITGGKLQLDGFASGAEVLGKDLQGNGDSGVARHPQGRDAVGVGCPAVGSPIESREAGGDAAVAPAGLVGLGVAPPGGGEVQGQVRRLRLHVDGALRHGGGKGFGDAAADDGQAQSPHLVRPVAPHLLRPVHRQGL